MAIPLTIPDALPRNYPAAPNSYPDALFRLHVEAAKRYLYETELKELLEQAGIPASYFEESGGSALTVANLSAFMQGLRLIVDDDKAVPYGSEAFARCSSLITRAAGVPTLLRGASASDKLFLKIRDAMGSFNRKTGANVLIKWHGDAESEVFEDTGQHCYGFTADSPICYTLTGFLGQAIVHLSGVSVALEETDCMALGALTCRWRCTLT